MKLTFLGTGTSTGVPFIGCKCVVCRSTDSRNNRLRTAALLQNETTTIVIDCGPDFRQQMLANAVEKIDAILITHEHRDHVAGLDDVRPYNAWSKKDIEIYATKDVQASLKKAFYYVFEGEKYPGAPMMNLVDIENNKNFNVNNIHITPIEFLHGKLPVLGFRFIDKNGKDITYLTDIKSISEAEKEKVKGTQTLVVSALQQTTHWSHFNLKEAIEFIEEMQPKVAYLVHISHQMGLHEEVQASLPPHIHLAYDGLEITI